MVILSISISRDSRLGENLPDGIRVIDSPGTCIENGRTERRGIGPDSAVYKNILEEEKDCHLLLAGKPGKEDGGISRA